MLILSKKKTFKVKGKKIMFEIALKIQAKHE
jgi:hypothetical protein